ncbi:hypothetical protein [Nannocystis bainbridge]|uniref:Uncharacterized protein n=1 Tax=Nannocystis bainbridge TaxID=2995303 RepID=A0ABT5E8U8_9BACT|nr:hypothetical protein [Nannocystis bainbridge]MDC0721171.1 hypothetical protein [Nannocystis bainbridge]
MAELHKTLEHGVRAASLFGVHPRAPPRSFMPSIRSLPGSALLFCAAAVVACEGGEGADPGTDTATDVPETCGVPSGEGTVHATAALESDDTVWTAAASPHIVDFPPIISEGQRLTIEPCAVVRFGDRVGMQIEGELIAEGAADKPIVFERAGAAAWDSLRVAETGRMRLAHATLRGGGALGNSRIDETGTLVLVGDPRSPQGLMPLASVQHVTIEDSASLGALLSQNATFSDDSSELTVTGSGSAPLRLWQRAASSVPSGQYTGNQDDEILIDEGFGNSQIVGEATLHDRGVPYHMVTGMMVVGSSGDDRTPGSLSIEPGVQLRFQPGSRLLVQAYVTEEAATGSLRALGTAEKPIVITSGADAPAPGDWVGITFKGTPSADNRIEHTTIAYAGGVSGISSYDCGLSGDTFSNEGAVVFYGQQPASVFLTSSRIEHSARDGVVRGWVGDPLDFTVTNTFVGVARCLQTFPQPLNDSCPTDPPCPK